MNKKQGIDPFYGKINYASVSQHALSISIQKTTAVVVKYIPSGS